ncbi:GxxExxY protein [Sphingobacterium sp.]|uniref:GxxExxY protein n=1 Tax=Sphingobacterium sp. TaxID=341027 RepID=UPI00289A62DE|nr:GxxExxY protein [Sphingobacterium sp.]
MCNCGSLRIGDWVQELIYQRALAEEFQLQNIGFQRELEMALLYKGVGIGSRRVDFLVENLVLVELKAISELTHVHLAQGKNYLEAYQIQTGLLINFGSSKLEFRRLYNNKI